MNKINHRTVISGVSPQVEEGRFPIKRIVGDEVRIEADIFADSHFEIAAQLLFRRSSEKNWSERSMEYVDNDRWKGLFSVTHLGKYEYTLHSWVDYFRTWQKDLKKKHRAGINISIDLKVGLQLIKDVLSHQENAELSRWFGLIKDTPDIEAQANLACDDELHKLMRNRYPNKSWVTEYHQVFEVMVEPKKAQFSSWYEFFPRSVKSDGKMHGTLKGCEEIVSEIADMGFDVIYLPPIHPIGITKRKGKNNQSKPSNSDPGSPWAIGAEEGGHKAIHPSLGTIQDFESLVKTAKNYDIEIAIDLTFQCSPDHPYIKEHPEWFKFRPDGSIQHAENPPKKYEDVIPFNFETSSAIQLWEELKSVVEFWIHLGIRVFRVDNPHTKPFPFWEWLIGSLKKQYPDLLFLAEAFTRPKVMYWLAKLGFTQSYTYFTWRRTKKELTDYVSFLTQTDVKEYFRPNFWPNTPDILSEELQHGGKATFISRLILAATLSSNYGVYGPAYELMVNEAVPNTEEYLDAEKYELKNWYKNSQESLRDLMKKINRIRKENEALQSTDNIKFYGIENEQILFFGKFSPDKSNAILAFVSLDPYKAQTGKFKVPLNDLSIRQSDTIRLQELLTDRPALWHGEEQEITLNPEQPACLYRLRQSMRKESDFEYFM